ncbi:diaminopimelate decarboxylase [Streptacidiphilus fuscans]|uniref:Diaminopimelate decarboxylase n=1 Tax=Streptacidiphilus fuscans TaxID=2789292 RepID=A0A931B239_9ACTN|nr:diaminopimelate decarboxylase [Streptacidiphilus fuscans]MBF9068848.1 diaminopimelate decarboxylase [Streptacidiphilus fuscans]
MTTTVLPTGTALPPATVLPPSVAVAPDDSWLGPWPASTRPAPHGDLTVGGVSLTEAADRFGTPVYLLDEDEIRARCHAYREAFPEAEIHYAAKAFLCRAMAHWAAEEGLGLDVCSRGELELAVTTGFPTEHMILHGNAKSPDELEAALRLGVGRIVIDSPAEIARIAALVPHGSRQKVLLRIAPGIAAGAHPAIRTGTVDQKFGLASTDGTAQLAVARVLEQPRLELVGLHCHLGSQITSVKPFVQAVRRMVGMMSWARQAHGVVLPELDLGGGHGIAYRPGEEALDLRTLAVRVQAELRASCATVDLPVPKLLLEPGRAIVGPAGVAVYRVLSVKHGGEGSGATGAAARHTFVAVDGGMSDNPRPALYGVRYSPRLIGREASAELRPAHVVGRHCEAGDIIASGVPLPADIRPGDLLAVPASGAYQVSMASGYNLVGRPPVVAVTGGSARLLVRRESLADVRSRDVGL